MYPWSEEPSDELLDEVPTQLPDEEHEDKLDASVPPTTLL